jgi:membrane protein implicated in regulation of membrane protease activity
MEWVETLDAHWHWLAIGLLLAAAEMAVPGVFLIWLSGAALVTGLLTWLLPIGLAWQIVIFAALAMIAVFSGRRYLRSNPIRPADPMMNDRGARLVGETVIVTQTIEGGTGRVRHGDTEWLVRGPDAAPGVRMRISGHDGTVLLVEHIH